MRTAAGLQGRAKTAGGGITVMVDVTKMPENSFGSVPTPAIVAPIEFTMKLVDYQNLGGHINNLKKLEDITQHMEVRISDWNEENPWPFPNDEKIIR